MLGTSCFYPHHRIHNAYWRWDDLGPALLKAARGILRRVIRQGPKTKAISVSQEFIERNRLIISALSRVLAIHGPSTATCL